MPPFDNLVPRPPGREVGERFWPWLQEQFEKIQQAGLLLGGGSGITDGDYGDVTAGGGGTTLTIDPNSVTFAKTQDIATARLLGRVTAGPGDIEELTALQALAFLGLNKGTANLDFGVFPGKSDASVAVVGQTLIAAGSIVKAWLRPVATGDHLPDEYIIDGPTVVAGNIIVGAGFTIYGTAPASEPTHDYLRSRSNNHPLCYGAWTVAWEWS